MSSRLVCTILTWTEPDIVINLFSHTPFVHNTVLLVYIIYYVLIKTLKKLLQIQYDTVYVHGFYSTLLLVVAF